MGYREIPVAPLREAFERSGLSASEVARRLGWTRTVPDSGRVLRQLGLYPTHNGHGHGYRTRETMSDDRAAELARVLGVDPVDVGL